MRIGINEAIVYCICGKTTHGQPRPITTSSFQTYLSCGIGFLRQINWQTANAEAAVATETMLRMEQRTSRVFLIASSSLGHTCESESSGCSQMSMEARIMEGDDKGMVMVIQVQRERGWCSSLMGEPPKRAVFIRSGREPERWVQFSYFERLLFRVRKNN